MEEFIGCVYYCQIYRLKALCAGFNLTFDVSQLASTAVIHVIIIVRVLSFTCQRTCQCQYFPALIFLDLICRHMPSIAIGAQLSVFSLTGLNGAFLVPNDGVLSSPALLPHTRAKPQDT
jgi:hypothetical protein